MADEYLRKQHKTFPVNRDAMEAYYRNHQSDYRSAEQVRWQILEIGFERHGGRADALALAQKAAAELRRGKTFASVTRKYFDDAPAEQERVFTRRTVAGPLPGPQADWWTQLNSSNDQELTAAIQQIAAGEDVKRVFNRPEWPYGLQPGSPVRVEGTTHFTEAGDGALENCSVQLQRTPSRIRRIRIRSRSGNEFNMFSRPVPNRTPPEQATILTGGVSVWIESLHNQIGCKPIEAAELSADRMVIWSRGALADGVGREGGVVQPADEPCDVYLEGNVVIFRGDPRNRGAMFRTEAKCATFHPRTNMVLLRNCEPVVDLLSVKDTGVWVERILQLGPNLCDGKCDSATPSPLENPPYRNQAADAILELRSHSATNNAEGAALDVGSRGAKNPRQSVAAEMAAPKYYDHCRTLDWTTPANVVDRHLSAVLEQLAPGETSYVLESADSFRIVRVTERRPGGCKPFDEVEPSIRRKLEQQVLQRIIEDVYRQATIESPYLPESKTRSPEQREPASSMNDPSIEFNSSSPYYNGFNLPERAAHQNRG